jgi:hypothetical protein
LKHAGIPYSRLHDTFGRFGAGEYVDISNIFKNFDADETKVTDFNMPVPANEFVLHKGKKVHLKIKIV